MLLENNKKFDTFLKTHIVIKLLITDINWRKTKYTSLYEIYRLVTRGSSLFNNKKNTP